jgi:hypothetical protein
MGEREKTRDPADAPSQSHAEPPGEGNSIEDAAREAADEMEKSDAPYAGRGDGG